MFVGIPTCVVSALLCNSAPCQNGGTCHLGAASYNCSCLYGFTGKLCANCKCSFVTKYLL